MLMYACDVRSCGPCSGDMMHSIANDNTVLSFRHKIIKNILNKRKTLII